MLWFYQILIYNEGKGNMCILWNIQLFIKQYFNLLFDNSLSLSNLGVNRQTLIYYICEQGTEYGKVNKGLIIQRYRHHISLTGHITITNTYISYGHE